MNSVNLYSIVSDYLKIFNDESEDLTLLKTQLKIRERLNDRKNFHGHIASAAIVLSPDKTKLLVVHHKFFDDWYLPGGHWEHDENDPQIAARREAIEETGVNIAESLSYASATENIPLDIVTYPYSARPEKDEPFHYHHDFRYIFRARNSKLKAQMSEVNECAWVDFGDEKLKNIARVIKKLQKFHVI
ncbi:MAG TPA: NUDIX domain-containing protein [Candidatus Saccharimonadales bacterium]|nr:NUDIX domain-containing protein [Candidatus Saccharimonadales bacterium]